MLMDDRDGGRRLEEIVGKYDVPKWPSVDRTGLQISQSGVEVTVTSTIPHAYSSLSKLIQTPATDPSQRSLRD